MRPAADRLGAVCREIERRTGLRTDARRARSVSGGSINQAYRLDCADQSLFVKLNDADSLAAFEAEVAGLEALRAAGGVAVPRVVACGLAGDSEGEAVGSAVEVTGSWVEVAESVGVVADSVREAVGSAGTAVESGSGAVASAGRVAYLALEWIEFGGRTAGAERRLGTGLAIQHRCLAERFGWHRHNTIGATPQRNTRSADWIEFLRRERLGFQLDLASGHGLPDDLLARGRRLLAGLEAFFPGHRPEPSLLHGDLWSGNWGADARGVPYIYDPAVYHGDREADLAMTRLFGGFGSDFYAAYEHEWPLDPGWEGRVDLYNLYHLLNHFNLFGAGYLGGVADAMTRLGH